MALLADLPPARIATVGKRSISCTGALTLLPARAPRQLDHQRHLQRLAIEQDPVLVLAVVPQPSP